jgi:hypothetical protein
LSVSCIFKPTTTMKKHLLLILSILSFNVSFGQITLENTYSLTSSTFNGPYFFHLIKFSAIGDKYVIGDNSIPQIKIYNLNHSIYKTINFPAPVLGAATSFFLANISDNLFNNDNLIEVAFQYEHYDNTLNWYAYEVSVIDENGTSLFHKDSARFQGYTTNTTSASSDEGFLKTSSGTKMVIQYQKKTDKSYEVYSLPGSLVAKLNTPNYEPSKFLIYPNPADSYTKIDFELENGQTGDVIIYNAAGNIIKKYKVDDTFGSLLLNSSDLPEGSYLYQLSTSKGSGSKKVMVIH